MLKNKPDFKHMNDNIVTRMVKERYANLPEEIMDKINALKVSAPKEYMFKKLKSSKEYPEVGTVFEVIMPQEISIKGIVVCNHINCILGEELLVVVILRPEIMMSNDIEEIDCLENMLIPPQIISTELWKKGYARNIGKSKFVMRPDYCFYDSVYDVFLDEYGKKYEQKKVIELFALTTVYGLSKDVQRELIIRGHEVNKFSDEEIGLFNQYLGKSYEILQEVEGDVYVISMDGELTYNDCFEHTDSKLYAEQRYKKVSSYRIIKFYSYYILNSNCDPQKWYRGRKDKNGNFDFDTYTCDLESLLESI